MTAATRTRTTARWHNDAASDAQVGAIARTRTRKIITPELAALLGAWDRTAALGTPTKREASNVIDALYAAEWLPREPAVTPTDHAGQAVKLEAKQVYRAADERIIRIQLSQSGNLYGKVLDTDTGAWEYLPAVQRELSGARLLTLDEAIAISAAIGQCVRCSRTLTADDSVRRGIGPICSKAFA
jgi:hypothetical protein